MRKLGVGVLGVGEMGKRHAENIRRLVPEARLVAVADAAAERAKQVAAELEIERSYGNLEAMLECKELDAGLIATPDKFHAQAVVAAARAGKAEISAPYSKMKAEIARILKQEGYIANYEIATEGKFPAIKIVSKVVNRSPAITGLKRVSCPCWRKFRSFSARWSPR